MQSSELKWADRQNTVFTVPQRAKTWCIHFMKEMTLSTYNSDFFISTVISEVTKVFTHCQREILLRDAIDTNDNVDNLTLPTNEK
jgi:hypothetical protein